MIEKRKRGRPPAGELKKTKMVCFWVTPEMYELILNASDLRNERIANFCCDAVMKRVRKIL